MTALEELRELTRQLDALWDAGRGEGDEADALRDRMDGPWYRLTAAERAELEARVRRETP